MASPLPSMFVSRTQPSKCLQLKQLYLHSTRIDNSGIGALACLPLLEEVDVLLCSGLTSLAPLGSRSLVKVLSKLPREHEREKD